MSPENISITLFLTLCMGARSLITYITANYIEYLQYFGLAALLPMIGFLYFYITKTRETGLETGGDKIWWTDLRPIHSFNYFLFSYLAINGYKDDAWKVLLFDVLFGLVAFLYHHSVNNDFQYLFE